MTSDTPADALKRVEARIALAESYVTTYRACLKYSSSTRIGTAVKEGYRKQYEAWLTQLLDAKAEWHKLKREEAGWLFQAALARQHGGWFADYLQGQGRAMREEYYKSVLPA